MPVNYVDHIPANATADHNISPAPASAAKPHIRPLAKMLLAACITGLAVGISNVGPPELTGLSLAFGAIFFCLFLAVRLVEVFNSPRS